MMAISVSFFLSPMCVWLHVWRYRITFTHCLYTQNSTRTMAWLTSLNNMRYILQSTATKCSPSTSHSHVATTILLLQLENKWWMHVSQAHADTENNWKCIYFVWSNVLRKYAAAYCCYCCQSNHRMTLTASCANFKLPLRTQKLC